MPSGQRASNYLCAFFFLNDTATPEIYTLSLHDALPIWFNRQQRKRRSPAVWYTKLPPTGAGDRKSTRLNSSHPSISYAVFCLKKKTFNNQADACHGVVRRSSALCGAAWAE